MCMYGKKSMCIEFSTIYILRHLGMLDGLERTTYCNPYLEIAIYNTSLFIVKEVQMKYKSTDIDLLLQSYTDNVYEMKGIIGGIWKHIFFKWENLK